MQLKLEELVDMFDEIQNYEYIIYDKKENNFIFVENVLVLFCPY
mgnify:CR=1 FL=1